MADPIPYKRGYSFTNYQADVPDKPLPGIRVDKELDDIAQASRDLTARVNAGIDVSINNDALEAVAEEIGKVVFVADNMDDVRAVADLGPNIELANDLFLGAHPSDPDEGNDGGPLAIGATYYNTVIGESRVWNGSDWVPVAKVSTGGVLQGSVEAAGGATTFYIGDFVAIQVARNGLVLEPGVDYTAAPPMITVPGAVDGDTITFFAILKGTITDASSITRQTVLTSAGVTTYALNTAGAPLNLTQTNHVLMGGSPFGMMTYGVDYTVVDGDLVLAFAPAANELYHLFSLPRFTNSEAQALLQDYKDAVAADADRAEAAANIAVASSNFTVADTDELLARTDPIPVGTKILTRAETGSYEVAASGGNITTAGGVPLYVRPKEGMLPVEHFGVTASTGDASAQMLMAVQEGILQKAKIVLPAFDIHLENEVSLSMVGDFLNGAVTIHGGGKGVSRVIVDGASAPSGGILLDSPNSRGARFDLQGFSVLADGTVNGPGLKVTMLPGGSRPSSSMSLQNVDCMGLQTASAVIGTNDYFTNGIDITGQWRARVFNIACCGVRDTNLGDYTNASRSWLMSEGLKADGCYDVLIDGCRFADAVTGIYSHDVGGVSAEVFRCYRSQIDMVRVGIDHYRPGSEPQFVVSDTYINYRDTGVRAKGVRIGSVSGCMIDQKDADQNSPVAPSDISLEFVKDFDVFNNHANSGSSTGDARRRQVTLLDTDTAAGKVTRNIRVYNNHAYSTMAAILFKGADTGRVDYTPGDYSQAVVATPVIDNSSEPVNLLLPRPYSARVRRVAAQAIGNDSFTALSFDTLASQDLSDIWAAGAPATINVPDGVGVTKARFRAYGIFATAATGRRALRLMKNGTELTMGFHDAETAVADVPTRITAVSEWLDVVASDTFTVEAYQNRGTPLDVTAYVEVEFR